MPPPSLTTIRKLRRVHKKHAREIALVARAIEQLVARLIELNNNAVNESNAVVGNDSVNVYTFGFDEHGSIDEQIERDETINGPGFVDLLNTARATANYAQRVAETTPPLLLPFE